MAQRPSREDNRSDIQEMPSCVGCGSSSSLPQAAVTVALPEADEPSLFSHTHFFHRAEGIIYIQ